MKKLFVICLMFMTFNVFGQQLNYPLKVNRLGDAYKYSQEYLKNIKDSVALVVFKAVILDKDTMIRKALNFEKDVIAKKLGKEDYDFYKKCLPNILNPKYREIDEKYLALLKKHFSKKEINIFYKKTLSLHVVVNKLDYLSSRKDVFENLENNLYSTIDETNLIMYLSAYLFNTSYRLYGFVD